MKLTYNNKQHAYWLDGKRCKGVTSVAKYPDDTYRLQLWDRRQVVIGMALSPPLTQRAAAHFDERDKIDAIAEEAKVVAKAHEASGRGTAIHRETERVDLSLAWVDTPETRAIREAWQTALDHAGLDIVPELIERIIVYPDQKIAGRFDRIARRRSDGQLVLLDIKTGINAIRYPHSTTIQAALYANAPLLAGPVPPDGGSTEQFEPMPTGMDLETAVVVYLPPEGPAEIHHIDIAAGWEAAQQICFPTITWRNRRDLTEQQIPAALTDVQATGPVAATTVPPPVTVVAAANQTPPAAQIQWLESWVRYLLDNGHGNALAREWSRHPDLPTFKHGGPQTVEHVAQLVAICETVEDAHGLPFGPSDPTMQPTTKAKARAQA